MPRGGRRHQNRPKMPHSIIEFHTQLTKNFVQNTLYNDVSLYSGMVTNNSGEGYTLIFMIPEVKEIFGIGSTFSFSCNGVLGPTFENLSLKLYVIMGMHNNEAFVIGFALMSESTTCAFKALYYKILHIEPRWRPKTIICNYNKEEAEAIKCVFPNIRIQGCWFYYSREMWKQLDVLGLKGFCKTNRLVYEQIHMWATFPLIPNDYVFSAVTNMKYSLKRILTETRPLCFNEYWKFKLFFKWYKRFWLKEFRADLFTFKTVDILRLNIEIELCSQHILANMECHTTPTPWQFIRSLLVYSDHAVTNYRKSYQALSERPRRTMNRHVEIYRHCLKRFTGKRVSLLQFIVEIMCITPDYMPPNVDDVSRFTPWNTLPSSTKGANHEDVIFVDNSSNEENTIPDGPPPVVPLIYAEFPTAPIVEERCCICLNEGPTVIASPCMHQYMCTTCYEFFLKLNPVECRSFYRCSLCRCITGFYVIAN